MLKIWASEVALYKLVHMYLTLQHAVFYTGACT
jgi:hypothetical protein